MNPAALVCTAVLGLLVFGGGVAVSVLRFKTGVISGPAREPDALLNRVVRAHANTCEYAGVLAALFLWHGTQPGPAWVMGLVVAATVCRVLLFAGLVAWPSMGRPNPIRFVGALGTYLAGLGLCGAMVAGLLS